MAEKTPMDTLKKVQVTNKVFALAAAHPSNQSEAMADDIIKSLPDGAAKDACAYEVEKLAKMSPDHPEVATTVANIVEFLNSIFTNEQVLSYFSPNVQGFIKVALIVLAACAATFGSYKLWEQATTAPAPAPAPDDHTAVVKAIESLGGKMDTQIKAQAAGFDKVIEAVNSKPVPVPVPPGPPSPDDPLTPSMPIKVPPEASVEWSVVRALAIGEVHWTVDVNAPCEWRALGDTLLVRPKIGATNFHVWASTRKDAKSPWSAPVRTLIIVVPPPPPLPIPPPTPPVPPGPTPSEELTAALTAAFAKDKDADKAMKVSQLAAVFRQAAKVTAMDSNYKTAKDIDDAIRFASQGAVGVLSIPNTRDAVGTWLRSQLPVLGQTVLDDQLRQKYVASWTVLALSLDKVK